MIEFYKDRVIRHNHPVMVYRNLTRKGVVWSIKQYNLVVAHTDSIVLSDCVCIINHKAQNRIKKTRNREVHAYIKGLISDANFISECTLVYDPFKYNYFYTLDLSSLPMAIKGAEYMKFDSTGVNCKNIW